MASDVQATIIKAVQGVGYLSAFILSLVICVPMSMNQDQFKGRCLLFTDGTWREGDGHFLAQWASQAYCNFTIFVAVIMFVISTIQFGRFVKFLRRGRDSSFFSAFIDVLLCILMCLFVFIAACFVSIGFSTWCMQMTKRFPTCDQAGSSVIEPMEGIDPSGFYFQMSVAQFGIWVSFTVWVMLLTFSVVKLCRYHHEENLRVSMAKERRGLLNEDLVSEVPVNTSYNERNTRRSRRHNQEGPFQEVTSGGPPVMLPASASEASHHGINRPEIGLVNEAQEDFQNRAPPPAQEIPSPAQQSQQSGAQSTGNNVGQGGDNLNLSLDDGSLSSMASSQHSYNSLPKGDQIGIDQRPDLLK